jgi:glycopeptide antibiotics resistance protein
MTVRAEAAPARSVRVWLAVLLVLYVGGMLTVLLSPVSPEALVAAVTGRIQAVPAFAAVRQGWVEFGANVLLFVPLGALVTWAFRRAWWGVLVAVVLSASAELAQMLLPGRLASPRDVLANVIGAVIGALVAGLVRAAVRRARRASAPRAGARSRAATGG